MPQLEQHDLDEEVRLEVRDYSCAHATIVHMRQVQDSFHYEY